MAYDTWGGSWGTSWALHWTRANPVPPTPNTTRISGVKHGDAKKKPLRIRFADGEREQTAEFIKAKLRERYPEPQDVDVPVKALAKPQKPKGPTKAALEAIRAEEERASVASYNEQIIALILLAAK